MIYLIGAIAGLALSIIIGYCCKINFGIPALVAAYLVGCFLGNLGVKDLLGFFPVPALFRLFSIMLFYGFALENGAFQVLIQKVVHRSRGNTYWIPPLIFLVCVVLSGSGVGAGVSTSIMAPIAMSLCSSIGTNYLVMIVAVTGGCGIGSNLPFSFGGVIIRELIGSTPFASDALGITMEIALASAVVETVAFLCIWLYRKPSTQRALVMDTPPDLTKTQKKSLVLLVGVLGFVIVATLLQEFLPAGAAQSMWAKVDIAFTCIVGALVAHFMGLADYRQVMKHRIPWGVLLIVSGSTLLMKVAVHAGAVDTLAGLVADNVPLILIPVLVSILSAVMSLFVSAITVVAPLMFPLVVEIAASTGTPVALLFIAVIAGATASGVSPFSSGGSAMLAGCPDEGDQQALVYRMMPLPILKTILVIALDLVLYLLLV